MGAKSKKYKNIDPLPDMEAYYYKFNRDNPRSPYNALRSSRSDYNSITVFSFRMLQLERIAKLLERVNVELQKTVLVGQQLHKILEKLCGESFVVETPNMSGDSLDSGIFISDNGWIHSTTSRSSILDSTPLPKRQPVADHIKISELLRTKSNRQQDLHRRYRKIRSALSVLVEHYAIEQCCQNNTITTGINFLPFYNGKGATYAVKVRTNYGYEGLPTHSPVIEILDVYGAPINTKIVPTPTVVISTDNSYSRSQCTKTIPEELPEWFMCRR